MPEKVVSLSSGDRVRLPSEPDERLIQKLEALLAEARSGNLRALGMVCVYSDGRLSTGWHDNHFVETGWALQAGANTLAHRLNASSE